MTLRAVLLGCLGAALICGFTYFNDAVLHQTGFVGNNLPISVYGGLILFILILNPVLFRLKRHLALTGKELAVILAMTLAACCIPGSGLMRTFTASLMMPHKFARTAMGWQGDKAQLTAGDILNWQSLCTKLGENSDSDLSLIGRRMRAFLPPHIRTMMTDAARENKCDKFHKQQILSALNSILDRSDFCPRKDLSLTGLSKHIVAEANRQYDEIDSIRRQMNSIRSESGNLSHLPNNVKEKQLSEGTKWCELAVYRLNRLLIQYTFPDEITRYRVGVVEMAPPSMLADIKMNESDALGGFIQGMAVGNKHISFNQIPWRAWLRTLMFWIPVILSLWIALIALSVVMHRQWADHEQLPYPIATFANSLLPQEGTARGTVFSSRIFWLSAVIVLAIHLNNYTCLWFPNWIRVRTGFNFDSLSPLFPMLADKWFIFRPTLYFTVIAFAYFLATDVSLSLGVGPILFSWVTGMLLSYGISLTGGGYLSLKPQTFLCCGAYFGVLLTLMYTGRHYYRTVLCRALLVPSHDKPESSAVYGARIFLVAIGIFVANLVAIGLDWQLALLYTAGIVLIFLVMSRIIAETGLFFIQPYFFPCVIIWGMFGAKALGPRTMLIMFLLTTVLVVDPRESLMPFMANSLKLLDMRKVRFGRTAILCAIALFIGLAVALPVTLYLQYDHGADITDTWSTDSVPRMAFDNVVQVKKELIARDSLEESTALSGWNRFGHIMPNKGCLVAFIIGLGLVIAFSAGRLHFAHWPLHPVLFLVWASYPGRCFAISFLVGWFVKIMIVKYGGSGLYQRLKPLMLGMVAGDMLGGILPAIFGLIYYHITGEPPVPFYILPG